MAHLFLSKPGELDEENLKNHLNLDLELEPLWMDFADEVLKALRNSIIPSDQAISYWRTSSELAVIRLLESFLAKKLPLNAKIAGSWWIKLAAN